MRRALREKLVAEGHDPDRIVKRRLRLQEHIENELNPPKRKIREWIKANWPTILKIILAVT